MGVMKMEKLLLVLVRLREWVEWVVMLWQWVMLSRFRIQFLVQFMI